MQPLTDEQVKRKENIMNIPVLSRRRHIITLLAFLFAAILTGIGSVYFMQGFEFVQNHRLDFRSIGAWAWITSPILFILSVQIIRWFAPCAEGAGIPQTIFAAKNMSVDNEKALSPLTSPVTLIIKIIALYIGILAGASTGREGPTVHVATCVFVGVLLLLRRFMGIRFDVRSAVVAGGAAGLAAAFNTPLAGVTFAIEELTPDRFSSVKDVVLFAIIAAAIAAKTMTGEYTYFGRLPEPSTVSINVILLIAVVGGLGGALFSTLLIKGKSMLGRFQKGLSMYVMIAILALGVLSLSILGGPNILGPGNEAARDLVSGQYGHWSVAFPWLKMAATLFTYWSGIAGGIFAPSLSMGAAIGANVGAWLHVPTDSCAMIGMAAFLSATIQAPMTAFVIIFEMTGHHQMLLPVMLGALLAYLIARILGSKHLYQTLSENYRFLLPTSEK